MKFSCPSAIYDVKKWPKLGYEIGPKLSLKLIAMKAKSYAELELSCEIDYLKVEQKSDSVCISQRKHTWSYHW